MTFKPAKHDLLCSAFAAAAIVMAGTSAQADPPDKGSKQWDRMVDYGGFISNLHRPSGAYCCDKRDGRMGDGGNELKEERIPQPDGTIRYRVLVTRELWREDSYNPDLPGAVLNHDYDKVIPPEGMWVDIDPDRVLIGSQKDLQECFRNHKNAKGEPDCVAPPDNVLWLVINKDNFGNLQAEPYCYWPIQNWTRNEPNQQARFAYRLEPR
jgi:hypothetical protein